jgi:hypothetical protein
MIRHMLPEMPGYVDLAPENAGAMTQKEAGFIQELLTLEGLKRGKNVLVDGSLRNASWNKVLQSLPIFFSSLSQHFFIVGVLRTHSP